MMRDDENIDGSQLVNGANEFYFLVPSKIAQVENPNLCRR